jgi:hypothetical protein
MNVKSGSLSSLLVPITHSPPVDTIANSVVLSVYQPSTPIILRSLNLSSRNGCVGV